MQQFWHLHWHGEPVRYLPWLWCWPPKQGHGAVPILGCAACTAGPAPVVVQSSDPSQQLQMLQLMSRSSLARGWWPARLSSGHGFHAHDPKLENM